MTSRLGAEASAVVAPSDERLARTATAQSTRAKRRMTSRIGCPHPFGHPRTRDRLSGQAEWMAAPGPTGGRPSAISRRLAFTGQVLHRGGMQDLTPDPSRT